MACEMTLADIQDRAFTHDGDSPMGRHVTNAKRHPNRWGVSIAKETRDSPKKIDAAVCVIGARMVRRLYLASADKQKKPRSGRVTGFA
jgi:phage terminase large subunit-like protein